MRTPSTAPLALSPIALAIGKYRTEIMGFAILWVMCYHLNPQQWFLKMLAAPGYIGVDLFLLVSGFGLYYSFQKSKNLAEYYWKRVKRVFPLYLLCIIVFLWIEDKLTPVNFLIYGSTLGFWGTSKQYFDWYVPSIMAFYFLSPLGIKLLAKSERLFFASLILLTAIAITLWQTLDLPQLQMLAYSRIPIFMWGIYLGKLAGLPQTEKVVASRGWIVIALLVIGLLYLANLKVNAQILWSFGLNWLPFLLIIPGLIVGLTIIFAWSKASINGIAQFLGTRSLELYLTHLVYYRYITKLAVPWLNQPLIKLSFSIILASALHALVSKLTLALEQKATKENGKI